MRQQDVVILRQLNQIQQTIHIINRQRRPRTLSAIHLTSPETTPDCVTAPAAKWLPGVARAWKRIGSLPVSYPSVTMDPDDDDVYDDDVDDDDDDILVDSFDSIGQFFVKVLRVQICHEQFAVNSTLIVLQSDMFDIYL